MRPAQVVLPLLRAALPAVTVSTWTEATGRTYPLVMIGRAGGSRHETRPRLLSVPELDFSAISDEAPESTDVLYDDVYMALFDAVRAQTVVPGVGYLHSLSEDAGPMTTRGPWPDTYMTSGTVRVGIRPHQ